MSTSAPKIPLKVPPIAPPHVRRLPSLSAALSERPASPEKFEPTNTFAYPWARAGGAAKNSTAAASQTRRLSLITGPPVAVLAVAVLAQQFRSRATRSVTGQASDHG